MVVASEVEAAFSVAADGRAMLDVVGPTGDGVNALVDAKRSVVANAVNFILIGDSVLLLRLLYRYWY